LSACSDPQATPFALHGKFQQLVLRQRISQQALMAKAPATALAALEPIRCPTAFFYEA
jgi:hypothetical protein